MSVDKAARPRGFTLIEVLVALAIVAFGLIGVFGQMSQSAISALRLRDKTLADWVALNKLTELRLSGEVPAVGTSSGDVEMANTRWHWEMRVSETSKLRRADVTVSFADAPDRPLALASGFVAQDQPTVSVTSSGWPPWNLEAASAQAQRQAQQPVTQPPADTGAAPK